MIAKTKTNVKVLRKPGRTDEVPGKPGTSKQQALGKPGGLSRCLVNLAQIYSFPIKLGPKPSRCKAS